MSRERGFAILAFAVAVACGGISSHERGSNTEASDDPSGGASGTGGTHAGAPSGNGGSEIPDASVDAADDGAGVVDASLDAPEGDAGTPGDASTECRAASQPGCNACCVQAEGACYIVSGTAYERSELIGTECAADCPRCARCLLATEMRARELACRDDCDCSVDPGVDPCFSPMGCGCYCERRNTYREACPDLDICP